MIQFVISTSLILFVLCNLSIVVRAMPVKTDPALLVISYDGFRPDYFNRNVTPHLNKFRKDGTSAEFMMNIFPTKTFVNHFTIATGLYAETHGVLSNDLYDYKIGKYIKYGYELFHYSNETVPIWTANERAGKASGCMMWPGSDFDYNGTKCTFTEKFSLNSKWTDRVDTALSWFRDEKRPANFVMLYIEDPDEHGHAYGPESDQVTDMLAMLDNLTGYIQEQLIQTGLDMRVNVIHLSDHGMNTVTPPNFIDLRKFVINGSCEIYGTSPVVQIVPTIGKEDEVYTRLTKAAGANGHFKIYKTNNMPARWHANNSVRMGPILAVADIGYGFHDLWGYADYFKEKYNVPITNESKYGVHGYDNDEESMHAIFMAKGPLFNSGKIIKPVNNIDLYNLFCLILNIDCIANHGSTKPEIWNELFIRPVGSRHQVKDLIMSAILFLAVVVAIIVAFVCIRRFRKRRQRDRTRITTVTLPDLGQNTNPLLGLDDTTTVNTYS